MSKDTKGNHQAPSEDSLLQSKICRLEGLAGSSPAFGTKINLNFLINVVIVII